MSPWDVAINGGNLVEGLEELGNEIVEKEDVHLHWTYCR
jgi:hypothetical protein